MKDAWFDGLVIRELFGLEEEDASSSVDEQRSFVGLDDNIQKNATPLHDDRLRITTFYVAIAERRTATHKDIIKGYVFDNFREAKLFACERAHDSDEAVFTNIDGKWIRVWKQDCHGNFLVTDELGGWSEAVPLHEYLLR